MSDISRHEWQELLSGYTTEVLVGNWVVAAATASGSTSFPVVLADTNNPATGSVGTPPIVGPSDAVNFTDARIVFGRGQETPLNPANPTPSTGLNYGFSTEVAGVSTDTSTSPPTTTVTIKDPLPQALAPGDHFTIFRTVNVEANVAQNVNEVGGVAVPTDANGNPYLPVESMLDVVPLTTISDQAANTDFASFTAPIAGRALCLLSVPTSSTVVLVATPAGGTATTLGAINGGVALAANQPYTFEWPVSRGAGYALQVTTAQSGTLAVSVEVVMA
jgi:hypothetical protein